LLDIKNKIIEIYNKQKAAQAGPTLPQPQPRDAED
jgi:hypothetical protein